MTSNKLIEERSPYLLQHASNPVYWYPWGEEAFQAAIESNKLIFLSVGYSTCHWCHVMERESFESQEVAQIMNENFINIKVDREERPDVDKVYMSFVQATTGGGGWPMSVFLTPKLKPIFGGTYFPPEDNPFGRPGFKTILKALSSKWELNKDKLMESGDKIMEAMAHANETASAAGVSSEAIATLDAQEVQKKCFEQLLRSYDPEMGGFSKAPKFPQPVNFNFLFHYYSLKPQEDRAKQGLKMVLHTLDMMAKGGIHDHISQGFARYSTDARWHVPHFEKMLYDQAQLVVAYSYAFQATQDSKFKAIVEDILTYVNRDLSHPLGGFFSAEDADSKPNSNSDHKIEGAFCVWTHDELEELLKKELFKDKTGQERNLLDLAKSYFNIKPNGNVDPSGDPHGELTNQNVLTMIGVDQSKLIEDFGLDNHDDLQSKIRSIQSILFEARQKRPRPHLDDKILTAWNGLMISGFSVSGMALKNSQYTQRAVMAANFLKEHLYNSETQTLYRSVYTGQEGSVEQLTQPIHGFVDDYAFLIKGLLDLYEATLDATWIEWADILQKRQNELFWDSQNFGYFTAPADDDSIILRLKEDQDGAEPSGNSVSSLNLLKLASYTENSDYKAMAGQIFSAYKETLERFPVALPEMTNGLMYFGPSPVQIIISGPENEEKTQALIQAVHGALLPFKILIRACENQKDSFVNQKLEILRNIPTDQSKAYLCKNFACSAPVESPDDLMKLILQE